MANELKCLPRLELTSCLNNINNLTGWDMDTENNLFGQVNCDYYTADDFKTSDTVHEFVSNTTCFSALNFNIRSLQANGEDLSYLLSDLSHNFSIIGLSETKLSFDKDCIVNINILGYNFLSQPSHTNAGGVGFFVRQDCQFHQRDDLCISTADYECLSIEFHNSKKSNLVCCVIYRHPDSEIKHFIDYYEKIMEKISNEKNFA